MVSDDYGFEIIEEYRNPRLPSLSKNYSDEQLALPCDISKEMEMLKFPERDIQRYKRERRQLEAQADTQKSQPKENWVVVKSSKSREYYINRKLKKFALSNAIAEYIHYKEGAQK